MSSLAHCNWGSAQSSALYRCDLKPPRCEAEHPDAVIAGPGGHHVLMSTSPLFTKIDHVGIAVADLDAAIAFYRDTFGVISVHEETNAEQGVREAMLVVGDGSTRLQLRAPLCE